MHGDAAVALEMAQSVASSEDLGWLRADPSGFPQKRLGKEGNVTGATEAGSVPPEDPRARERPRLASDAGFMPRMCAWCNSKQPHRTPRSGPQGGLSHASRPMAV